MPTYSVADIKDKYLYAQIRVPIYGRPNDESTFLRYVEPGQVVGLVYSWLDPIPGQRENYWWQFKQDGQWFYAEHKKGYYSMEKLRQQGVLTEQEKAEANKTTLEKAGDILLKGLMIWAGVKLISPLINRAR